MEAVFYDIQQFFPLAETGRLTLFLLFKVKLLQLTGNDRRF
jgi:hypothetical protein